MELIERLEFLSKLKFSDEEKQKFNKEFQDIVKMVDEIQRIETSEAVQDANAISMNNLREDEILPSLEQTNVLKNAPKQKDGCYVTPLVVE